MERPNEGLRARKKRAARETIATAARRLFAERGFDAVRVAEVAVAADVSEKTVFNHFATKEDLAFAGREERHARLLADIEKRPPGVSVLDVFRAATTAMIDEFAAGGDDDLAKIIKGSRPLQERLTTGWEEEAAALTAVIAETSGAGEGDIVPAIVARTLSWTHRLVFRAALDGLPAARLREMADRSYDQFAAGLGDYG
jgi:AcrR family transcriptional regulator